MYFEREKIESSFINQKNKSYYLTHHQVFYVFILCFERQFCFEAIISTFFKYDKNIIIRIKKMKCEHGQIITKFCISQSCNFSSCAACTYCMKKNHSHPGHQQTLNIKQLESLIQKLTIKKDKRLKQQSLKQLITNYFQSFKAQINKSFQIVCKNMIDRISNSLLYKQKVLDGYKKCRLKQYTKISGEQLRKLHRLNINSKQDILKQQQKSYKEQVLKIQQTVQSIKNVFQVYKQQIQYYDHHFSCDSFFYKRIIELSQKILIQNGCNQPKQHEQMPIKIKITSNHINNQNNTINQKGKINPQSQNHENNNLIKPQSDKPILLSLEEYKSMKSTQSLKTKQPVNYNTLNINNDKKQRKLSITIQQQKMSKSSQNNNSSFYNEIINENEQQNHHIHPMSKRKKSLHHENQHAQNIKNSYNKKSTNKKCTCQSQNTYFNSNLLNLKSITPKQSHNTSFMIQKQFKCKQCNSQQLDGETKVKSKILLQNKQIHFPHQNQQHKMFDHKDQIKKQIIKLQINQLNFNNVDEIQSPLIRKKIKSNQQQQKTVNSNIIHERQHQTYIQKEQINLSQNQLKSLALLIQSIKLPPQKAMKYLRKSAILCPYNLSTAQYLSYLLIENNHPKQCLQLCNLMIAKIFSYNQNISISVHILNNKASALNELGRFSQCIQFLQKIVQRTPKDSLYKNLGDAYCALGIYQKSIINYQKCISLNNQYDQAYYNMAVCFYCQHHYEQAFQVVSEAIKINADVDEYIQLYRNAKSHIK